VKNKFTDRLADFFGSLLDESEGKVSFAAGRVTKVECARSGEFTAMGGKRVKFTPESLKGIAENFADAKKLKIGHGPILTDTPNAGEVTGLSYDGKRDRLIASVKPTEHLAAQNRSGAFERVSMELVPKGEGYALDALSFLGAHDPAITDLEPVALAAGEERVILCCAEEEGTETVAMAEPSTEQRRKWADQGIAMPDGSYYIRNSDDLHNAIQAFGRSGNPAATKAHIIKRAKALGLTNVLPADWPGSTKKAAASAEEEQVEKLELAEARIKELEAEHKKFAESDVDRFLSSDQATKKIPLPILKAGNLKRVLLAAANLKKDPGKVMLAGTDGKTETESSLYEAIKGLFLALPDKVAGTEEIATASRAAEETDEVKKTRLAGADEESARLDFAARKEMQAEKAKGVEISYLDAVRRVQMAGAK